MQFATKSGDGFAVRLVAVSNYADDHERTVPEAKLPFKAVLEEFQKLFADYLSQSKRTSVIEH